MVGNTPLIDVRINKKNEMLVDPGLYFYYKMFAPFSNNIAQYLDPLMNDPIERKGIVEGSTWVMGQYLGFGEYNYNPKKTVKWDVKDIKEHVDREKAKNKSDTLLDSTPRDAWGMKEKLVADPDDPSVDAMNPFLLAVPGDLPGLDDLPPLPE